VSRQYEVDLVVGQIVERAGVVQQQQPQVLLAARVPLEEVAQVGFAFAPHEVGADDLDGAHPRVDRGRVVHQQCHAIGGEAVAHDVDCLVVVVAEDGEAAARQAS